MVRNNDDDQQHEAYLEGGKGFGQRHVQVILLFFGVTMVYFLRIVLSVAIEDMTAENNTSSYPTFLWTTSQQDLVLSSFFWGYLIPQLPAGSMAVHFGPKWLVLAGVAGSAALGVLSPVASQLGGWMLLCALRMLQGVLQGCVYPSTHTMLSHWVPPQERARWTSVVYNGLAAGTGLGMAVTGVLSSRFGWPFAFYVPGAIGLVWGALWCWLGCNSPSDSTSISDAEHEYIAESFHGASTDEKKLPVPWIKIFKSYRVWILVLIHCTQNFGHWVLSTKMPDFMSDVLNLDIEDNGLLSGLPYFSLLLVTFAISYISEEVNNRCPISKTFSRKMFNTIAHWGSGFSLLILAFVEPTQTTAVLLLTVAVSFEAGTLPGFMSNHMDLSPNFGGPIMSVTNCFAAVIAILAPIAVGDITGDTSTMSLEEKESRWKIVFIMTSSVYFIGNLLFIIFGSAEIQPWNDPKPRRMSVFSVLSGKSYKSSRSRKSTTEPKTLKDNEGAQPNRAV